MIFYNFIIIKITRGVACSQPSYMQPRGDSFYLFLKKIVTDEPRVAFIVIKHWQLAKMIFNI